MADDTLWGNVQGLLDEYAEPLLIGGQIGSVYLRQQVERAARARRQMMLDAERARQAGIAEKSRQTFQQTAAQFAPEDVEERRREEEERLRAQLAAPQAPASVLQNYTAAQPVSVQGDLTRKVGETLAETRRNAERLALAQSFGTSRAADSRTLARAGADISGFGRQARNSAAVLPYELGASDSAGGGYRRASDILGVGTGLAGLYGLTRRPRNRAAQMPGYGTTERTF